MQNQKSDVWQQVPWKTIQDCINIKETWDYAPVVVALLEL
jgi:hypothetical protein